MYGYHAFPPFRNKALLRLLGDFKVQYMVYFAELFYFFLTVGVPEFWMHKNGPFFEGFVLPRTWDFPFKHVTASLHAELTQRQKLWCWNSKCLMFIELKPHAAFVEDPHIKCTV